MGRGQCLLSICALRRAASSWQGPVETESSSFFSALCQCCVSFRGHSASFRNLAAASHHQHPGYPPDTSVFFPWVSGGGGVPAFSGCFCEGYGTTGVMDVAYVAYVGPVACPSEATELLAFPSPLPLSECATSSCLFGSYLPETSRSIGRSGIGLTETLCHLVPFGAAFPWCCSGYADHCVSALPWADKDAVMLASLDVVTPPGLSPCFGFVIVAISPAPRTVPVTVPVWDPFSPTGATTLCHSVRLW
jgi:hypothetical protein